MANQIPTYYVTQYTENVEFIVQQMAGRLVDASDVRTHYGQSATSVEQVAPVTYNVRTGRAQPLVPADTGTNRRWVYPTILDFNDLVDNFDKLKILIDPTSYIAKNAAFALKRGMDDLWIAAFFGTAQTGQTGSTAVTFPSSQQVSVNVGSSGGATPTNMNVPKLRNARLILLQNEVDLENDPAYCGMAGFQLDDMLNQAQAISYDFQDKPVLENGQITRFIGFRFIHTERLPLNASSQRQNPAWVKSGMHFGIWQDINTNVSQRFDLSSLPYQVYVSMVGGATREQEQKCVSIACTEP